MENSAVRIFRLDPRTSGAELSATVVALRTVIDLSRVVPFESGKAIVVRSTADKLALAEAMLGALSHPAVLAEYQSKEGLLEILPFPSAGESELLGLITGIRTLCDLQRIYPLGRNGIAVNGPPDRIAAAGWIVHQLSPQSGAAPASDPPAYAMEKNSVARIFRLDPKWSDRELAAAVTAIRLFTHVQRLYLSKAALYWLALPGKNSPSPSGCFTNSPPSRTLR
jgi:hypothetical protein